MIRLLWLFIFLFFISGAHAQNTTCALRPIGDNSNACASTSFLWQFMTGVHTGPITPGNPIVGNPAGNGFVQGTRQGNTTKFATTSGSFSNGDCRSTDSNGNEISAGGPCTVGGGGGTVSAGLAGQYGYYPTAGTVIAGTSFPAPIPNAPGSAQTTTANCTASNTTVTLAAAIDFANGQGIGLEHCGATFTGAAPTGVSAFATGDGQQGPAGTTTYNYSVACVDNTGGVGAAVAAAQITNGNATLGTLTIGSGSGQLAYNHILYTTSCPAVAIWRKIGAGSYHLIAVTSVSTASGEGNAYTDNGQPTLVVPWIPDTPTASALNDRLVTTISSGAGTTSIVVAAAPTNNGTSVLTRHDDTAALGTYLATAAGIILPAGTYNIEGITLPSNLTYLSGQGTSTLINGWSTTTATLASSVSGFSISNMKVVNQPLDAPAIALSSISNCSAHDLILIGLYGVDLESASNCTVRNNNVSSWGLRGIQDNSGNSDTIINNIIGIGYDSGYGGQAGIAVTNGVYELVAHNKISGGTFWGIVFGVLVEDSKIDGNLIIGSQRESIHLAGTEIENMVTNNYINSTSTSIDYGISISDDDMNGSTIFGNLIQGNYVNEAGNSGIALTQFGGTSLTISQNTIADNFVFNADQMAIGSNSAGIFLDGSSITDTQVMGNVVVSGLAGWVILESNVTYGYPTNTTVGPNSGIPGSFGTVSLSGAGSAKLVGGATGF